MVKLAGVVGGELLSPNLLTVLASLTKDAKWRVRMAIFELIGELSIAFGLEIFQRSLEPIFMQYLTNTAASVRNMGVEKSAAMAKAFGPDWVVANFVPKVVEHYNVEQQGFNYRMCAIESLSACMPYLSKEQVTDHIVPTILKTTADRIPNVQFCVARVIKTNKAFFDPQVFLSQITPKLREMAQDSDKDVAYFATSAL
jgi:serine/threonine-protein phosphatase 2A regulatory subunit A